MPVRVPTLDGEDKLPARFWRTGTTEGTVAAGDALAKVGSLTQASNYTLALAAAGRVVEITAAGAATVTIPPNSAVAFPVGTVVEVMQYGTGQVTIAAGVGVTVRSPASFTTRARYSSVALRQRAANEWIVSGDMT